MFANSPIPEGRVTLTARQQEILHFVNAHLAQHGYPPTVREIGAAVGLTSSSTVHAHLANLERDGFLRRDPTKPRAMELMDRGATAPREQQGYRLLPVLGQIAAGAPLLAEQNVEDEIAVPDLLTGSGDNFILKVRGDSMIGDGINDGDFVVIRSQADASEGEIVAALVDGEEATVKRIYREDGRVRLQPSNPSLDPMFPDHVQVLGRVVGVFRKV